MSLIVSSGVASELPPHLSIAVIPSVTLAIANLSLVIGSSSLAHCAAVMIACSQSICSDFFRIICFARSSRDIITPLLVLISATVIDRELSITQRVFGILDDLSSCKNPNTTNSNPTMMSTPRMNRLRGRVMKLTGKFVIIIYLMIISLSPGCLVHSM
jgi:hypothetical protein